MYISEKIKQHTMLSWDSKSKIFIDAPMGSGKTEFVIKNFIPWAMLKGWKILILCNRTNLKDSYHVELDDIRLKMAQKFARNSDEFYFYYNLVTVRTYQSLEKAFNQDAIMSQYNVLICDEVHSLYSDSTFDPYTIETYATILRNCSNKLTMFISATPENIFPKIIDDLESQGDIIPYINIVSGEVQIPHYIEIKPDFSYLDVKYARSIERIVDENLADATDSKWIYFVPSAKEGKDISNLLIKGGISKSEINFLSRENLNSTNVAREVSETIITKKTFPGRILITTLVLEAGVSIKDAKVKNMVNLHYSKESFIQCIGRKRIEANERVRLYICSRDSTFFSIKKRTNDIACKTANILIQYAQTNTAMYLSTAASLFMANPENSHISSFAYLKPIKYNGTLSLYPCINSISVDKLNKDQKFYEYILDGLERDVDAWGHLQFAWLNLVEKTEACLDENIDIKCINELMQKLIMYAKIKEFTKDELKIIKIEFATILCKYYPHEFRADRSPSTSKLNLKLAELNLAYEIVCKKNRSGNRYYIQNKEQVEEKRE